MEEKTKLCIKGFEDRGITSPEAENLFQVVHLKGLNRMVFFKDEMGEEIELLRIEEAKGEELIRLTKERLMKLKGKDLNKKIIKLYGKRISDSELIEIEGELKIISSFNFYIYC